MCFVEVAVALERHIPTNSVVALTTGLVRVHAPLIIVVLSSFICKLRAITFYSEHT